MDPVVQGAMLVDLDSGDVVKGEAWVFSHDVFSRRLQLSYPAFMVAARRDHFARWAIGRASYHFPNKIHLSSRNHFSYAGDGVEYFLHFVVM
jgi:hypothetical protein